MIKNSLYILISILFLYSCEGSKKTKTETQFKSIIDNVIGKELFLPDNMTIYKPFNNYTYDSLEVISSKLKITTFINASCGSCISEINRWESFSKELAKFNVPVLLIFESNDQFELLHYLCETGTVANSSFPFFMDIKNEYLINNSFMKTTNSMRTVLVDDKNKILLIGNPIKSDKIKDMYIKEIVKIANSK